MAEADDDYPWPDGVRKNPAHLIGVADLSRLNYLEEENVVYNLKVRYEKDQSEIYTNVASIMIAVNPYQSLPIYGEEVMKGYRGLKRFDLANMPPHCYAVAEEAYQLLAKTGIDQSMVICGESGSGKTESAKVFMRYLSSRTPAEEKRAGGMSIEQQFLEANPLLEAFGNAQTNMNNNSSRYGKFTKVLFDTKTDAKAPRIIGSFIETYLLEKSRVVHQDPGERNYHVFYQLFKGLPEKTRTDWALDDMAGFHYINQSGSYETPGMSDADTFAATQQAMKNLGFSEENINGIFQHCAALLHLGNIKFDESKQDAAAVAGGGSAAAKSIAAHLFQIDEAGLEKRLTTKTIKAGMQVIEKELSYEDALYNRDAMAKALYQGLFTWIVSQVNSVLFDAKADDVNWIGVLDVFGFENFEHNNSFEQFCINFANERLQQYFNEHVIQSEQDEYLREALPWEPLEVADNQDTIDLVENKPQGIIAVLDSACLMPKGSDEIFVNNVFTVHRKHPRIKQANSRQKKSDSGKKRGATRERFNGFTIDHYAGKVTYNADGFLDKNNDSTHPDTAKLFEASSSAVTAASVAPPAGADGAGAKKNARKTFISVGANFQAQLSSLMNTLRSSAPHFVRCVNPNQFKQPSAFDPDYVRPQLRCAGLIEALRVLKLGYPSRTSYDHIFDRYGHILKDGKGMELNKKDFTEAVFMAFGMDRGGYQLGLTKVFFKPGKQEFLEEVLGSSPDLSQEMIDRIRALMVKKRVTRVRAAALLAVRMQITVNRVRAQGKLGSLFGTAHVIGRVFKQPLILVKVNRAVVTLQSQIRAYVQAKKIAEKRQALKTLRSIVERQHRRVQLRAAMEERVVKLRETKSTCATELQRLYRRTVLSRGIRARLASLVAETQRRIEEEKQKAEEERQKAEEERQRRLQEERKRAEEEERKRREEEERLRKEEEERRAKEEEERKKAEEEEKKRAEEARQQRVEAERKEREERLERERQEAEEADRKRKEAEERESKAREEEKARKAEQERRAAEKAARWQAQIEAARKEKLQQAADQRKAAVESQVKLEQEFKGERRKSITAPVLNPMLQPSAFKAKHEEATKRPRPPPPKGPIPQKVLEAHRRRTVAMERSKQLSATGPQPKTDSGDFKKSSEDAKEQEETHEQKSERHRQVLLQGGKFLKYGRRGAPHIKHVCMNVLGNLHWADRPMDPRKMQPSSSFLRLKDVSDVVAGKESVVFQRKVAKNAYAGICFSVVLRDRTLDLQAINTVERDKWIEALKFVIREAQDGMTNFITGKKDGQPSTIPSLSTDKSAASGSSSNSEMSVTEFSVSDDTQPTTRPASMSFSSDDPAGMRTFLEYGERLTKHGRQGKPKQRWFNAVDNKLHWGESPRPSSSVDSSFIELAEVKSIRVGKVTDIFQRSHSAPPECCFSLILKSRTLDLQASNQELRNSWVAALTRAVERAKKQAHNAWLVSKREQSVLSRKSITGRQAGEDEIRAGTSARYRSQTSAGGTLGRNFFSRGRSQTSAGGSSLTAAFSEMEVEEVDVGGGATEDKKDEGDEDAEPTVDLTKVIRSMARRGSVEIMAQHMKRNMERQARMQSMSRKK